MLANSKETVDSIKTDLKALQRIFNRNFQDINIKLGWIIRSERDEQVYWEELVNRRSLTERFITCRIRPLHVANTFIVLEMMQSLEASLCHNLFIKLFIKNNKIV